jgi:Peptidase M50B-like
MVTVLCGSAPVMHRLPAPVVVLLGLVVVPLVVLPEIWAMFRHIGLMAHEGAHALVGSGLGHRVQQVRINRDGTGSTLLRITAGSGAGAAFVGYLGPSAFGLIAAALIAHALIAPVLWTGVVLLLILLGTVRGLFGVVMVLSTCALLYVVARYAPESLKAVTAYSLSWILLLGGLRVVLQRGTDADDAHELRRITRLPRALWSGLWAVLTLVALCFGATLLI